MEFQYKGLKAALERVEVTDTEIDRHLEKLRQQASMERPDKEPYALDDAFAREVGQCENLAQMREKMGEALRAHYDERAEEELRDRLIRQAAATLDYTPTEDEVADGAQKQLETLRAQLAQRNLTVEAYCSFSGTTQEQLLEDLAEDSRQLLKIQAAIDKIAALEDVTVTEKDVADACAEICRINRITASELTKVYDDALAETVRTSVITGKVLTLVRNAAIVEE